MSQQTSASTKKRRLPGKGTKKVRRLFSIMRNVTETSEVTNMIILTRLSFLMFLAVLGVIAVTAVTMHEQTIPTQSPEYQNIAVSDLESTNTRGTIFDCNGVVLARSYLDEQGGQKRDYPYPEAFSHLLGTTYGTSFGNHGIEAYYHSDLVGSRKDNIRKSEGDSVYSTVNADIQQAIYSAAASIDEGGVVVTDCNTGAVIAMVSFPTYDLTVSAEEANALYLTSEYVNKCMRQLTPGSVFKLLSACVLIDNDCTDEMYDTGVAEFEDGVEPIRNYESGENGQCDVVRAIERSSNVWFSTSVWNLCNRGGSFSAGTYIAGLQKLGMNDKIITQLGTLHQDHNMSHADKNEVLQSSFGQGGLMVTPLYMNCLVSAIATDGTMYTPYFVSKTVSPKGKTVKETEPIALEHSVSEAAREEVRKGMIAASDKTYGLTYKGQFGEIYAKTGTAEIIKEGEKERNNKWITMAFPVSDPQFAVTAVDISGGGMSSELFGVAQSVIDILADYIEVPELPEE
ncbi:MAG: hypothetical protein IJC45_05030 [Clostridia bacterium]|nr:hypothetical protein [Clostridia bacterium]